MEYKQQPSSSRKPFQVQQPNQNTGQQNQGEGQYLIVDKPHVAFTIWSFLITCVCIGLFAYVNSYFVLTLHNVISYQNIQQNTETFSCQQYFCDRTLYNYMNYYTFYTNCNNQICTQIICASYKSNSCGSNQYWPDLNRYFACEPMCPGYLKTDYPDILLVGYSLGIAAAVSFAIYLVVYLLTGIFFNIKSRELSGFQRVALLLGLFCPAWKYYFFRKRTFWGDFDISLRAIVVIDYISAFFLLFTTAIYIWFYVVGAWFDNRQIALFFMLLGSFMTHWAMCWTNGRAFWKVNN